MLPDVDVWFAFNERFDVTEALETTVLEHAVSVPHHLDNLRECFKTTEFSKF